MPRWLEPNEKLPIVSRGGGSTANVRLSRLSPSYQRRWWRFRTFKTGTCRRSHYLPVVIPFADRSASLLLLSNSESNWVARLNTLPRRLVANWKQSRSANSGRTRMFDGLLKTFIISGPLQLCNQTAVVKALQSAAGRVGHQSNILQSTVSAKIS